MFAHETLISLSERLGTAGVDPRYAARGSEKIGAVIEFNSTDLARVQAFLDRLNERGIIKQTTARTFNADHGAPVWYIP